MSRRVTAASVSAKRQQPGTSSLERAGLQVSLRISSDAHDDLQYLLNFILIMTGIHSVPIGFIINSIDY